MGWRTSRANYYRSKPPKDAPENPAIVEDDGGLEGPVRIKVKLGSSRELEINHTTSSTFIGLDGKPMSVQECLNSFFGKLSDLFTNEDELRKIWSIHSPEEHCLNNYLKPDLEWTN